MLRRLWCSVRLKGFGACGAPGLTQNETVLHDATRNSRVGGTHPSARGMIARRAMARRELCERLEVARFGGPLERCRTVYAETFRDLLVSVAGPQFPKGGRAVGLFRLPSGS